MRTIRKGMKGDDVKVVQDIVGVLQDGIFGSTTELAVIIWQQAHRLTPDGVFGINSWMKAKSIFESSSGLKVNELTDQLLTSTFGADGQFGVGYVDDRMTPLTPAEAAKALSDGYKLVTGKAPSKAILALLIGQTAGETGNWKSIHNYNFGNVRGTSSSGLWTSFRASEIKNGVEVFLDPGPGNKFRAYNSAAEGAADYIKALKDRPNWWNGLQTGTVNGFIEGLTSVPKYFTANPTLYLTVLQNRVASYQTLANQYGGSAIGVVAVIGAGIAAFFGFRTVRRTRQLMR